MLREYHLLSPFAFMLFQNLLTYFAPNIHLPVRIEAASSGGSWCCCLYEMWCDWRWRWRRSPVATIIIAGSLLTPATPNRYRGFIPPTWLVPTTTNNSWFVPCTARNTWFVPWAPRHPNFVPTTTRYTHLIPSTIATQHSWLFFKPWCCFFHPFYLFRTKIMQISPAVQSM